MKVDTCNEYGNLKSVIVGDIEGFSWPTDDDFFDKMIDKSSYHTKLTRGSIAEDVVDITKHQLDELCEILDKQGVSILRPTGLKDHWRLSARDVLLTIGTKIIQCPTPYVSRREEYNFYPSLQDVIKLDYPEKIDDPFFDAANICKFDDKLLYLVSSTANKAGAQLLQSVVGSSYEVITWEGVYAHAHIDSTLISLNKDTILLNGSRCNENNLPIFLKDYKKIYVDDIEALSFSEFPFASKWIGMNILSINGDTIIVDPFYKSLINLLESKGFKVLQTPFNHARTLGGGFHCITCDLERESV